MREASLSASIPTDLPFRTFIKARKAGYTEASTCDADVLSLAVLVFGDDALRFRLFDALNRRRLASVHDAVTPVPRAHPEGTLEHVGCA